MMKICRIFRKYSQGRKASRGLTLIEVLIATVVMSILMAALLTLYSEGQKYFINENTQADVLQESRYPLEWLARDIKGSTSVVSSWGSYSTSENTLVLQVPSVDGSGLIIDVEAEFDYIIYRTSTGRLQRIVDANDGVSSRTDRSRFLAENVTSLSLTYYDATDTQLSSGYEAAASVKMALAISEKGLGRTFQETLNSKVKLRNKA
ncbi:MAG: prepilin-type N-terminal cleavage/methylation domain-containing protein [Candidatus Aminicenantales bacterium]